MINDTSKASPAQYLSIIGKTIQLQMWAQYFSELLLGVSHLKKLPTLSLSLPLLLSLSSAVSFSVLVSVTVSVTLLVSVAVSVTLLVSVTT